MKKLLTAFFITFLTLTRLFPQSDSAFLFIDDSTLIDVGYTEEKYGNISLAIDVIEKKEFNQGFLISPMELIIGKASGVLTTRESGTPGSGFDIIIRGKSSLVANEHPFYVIDGIPFNDGEIDGMRNPLNCINPNDIESFTILKGTAAASIYGGRASNGVILIKTKNGAADKPFHLEYQGKLSLSTPRKRDVFSAGEYRSLVNERYSNNPDVIALMGTSETDWQDEIYKNAMGSDNLLSASGGIKNLPYRVSVGYTNQDGVLETDQFSRLTYNLHLDPQFFKKHLGVHAGVKGMYTNNRFADPENIPRAQAFDPTQNVYDPGNAFGGYFYWPDALGEPLQVAPPNPLAKLEMTTNESKVNRIMWNVGLDYKMHFLPDLKIIVNYACDRVQSNRNQFVPANASWEYDAFLAGAIDSINQLNKTRFIETMLAYTRYFEKSNSNLNVFAGFSRQSFENDDDYQFYSAAGELFRWSKNGYSTNIGSFYGSLNFSLQQKYIFNFSYRRDGSSTFSKENRWSNYPSFSFAWNIANENFLKDSRVVSDLKIRAGYGKTGNINFRHGPIDFYTEYYQTSIDPNLVAESVLGFDLGIDYGFINQKITGSVDFYSRQTDQMMYLMWGFNNMVLTNAGAIKNTGFEFSINALAISKQNVKWSWNYNLSFNKNEIGTEGNDFVRMFVGPINGGVGNTIQIQEPGYPAYSYYVYEQVYDQDGKPIEGVYVDRNGDDLSDERDLYPYQTPFPKVSMGISSMMTVKNWEFGFLGTIYLGNYVYNNLDSRYGVYSQITGFYDSYLNAATPNVDETQFVTNQYLSDYYVQDASFFKLNYLKIAYDFTPVIKGNWTFQLFTTAQNLFTISTYSGPEPEIAGGIDYATYPSPRIFMLGLNVGLN